MDDSFRWELQRHGVDVSGALWLVSGDEDTYEKCLKLFMVDRTITDFVSAVAFEQWQIAHTLVKTLRGISGNIGFFELSDLCLTLQRAIENDELIVAKRVMRELIAKHRDVIDIIANHYCP